MRKALVAIGVAAALAGAGLARAEAPSSARDPFMSTPPSATVYANDQHLGFSVRSSLIRWLGGVPVARERDLRAAERDRWWGQSIPMAEPAPAHAGR